MIDLSALPECYILLLQPDTPSDIQLKDIKKRYMERGYHLVTPHNIVRIETVMKKPSTFYAIEVRKEL